MLKDDEIFIPFLLLLYGLKNGVVACFCFFTGSEQKSIYILRNRYYI